jgi:galactokinase
MDQLTIAAGIAGHALMIDCHQLHILPVPVPDDVEIVIVHSGQHRELVTSDYGLRRAQCEAAEDLIGPLRLASSDEVDEIDDPVLQARARHVVTENKRVSIFAEALKAGDYSEAGQQMRDSHKSLGRDFEVSTLALDALVDDLVSVPGVYGARLTGAGFGGAVVALARPGTLSRGFVVRASAGARVL